MKRLLFIITICLTAITATAQQPRGYNQRPDYKYHYDGKTITPGYHYDQRSGWNYNTYPGGRFAYRDGYVPMRYYYPSPRYYPNSNYAQILNRMVYGW